MMRARHLAGKLGFALCGAVAVTLAGCTTYAPPPRGGAAYVEIRAESDFYEPLSPYGRWEMVGSFGRCWIPGGVGADWSPYSNGYWQRSDAGWYWASDEPWGWATYHYGRWDSSPEHGWYWVPQTQWAPAWVSWREGGGYVGWAPLGPSGRAVVDINRGGPTSGGYVFVEERRFLDPVRSTTIIVNNTVINQTVINEGPGAAVVERASGRSTQAVPVRQLRGKEEAKIVGRHPVPKTIHDQAVPTPARNQAENAPPVREPQPRPIEPKANPAPGRDQVENARPAHERQPPEAANEVHQAAGPLQSATRDGEKRAQQPKARENSRPVSAAEAEPENRPQANHETQQTPPQAKHETAPMDHHENRPQASHETQQTPPQAKHEAKPAAERPGATGEPADQKRGKDDEKKD